MTHPRKTILAIALLTAIALNPPPTSGQAAKRPTVVSPEVHADGKVTFRLYAPSAAKVLLSSGEMQPALKGGSFPLTKGEDGVWSTTLGPLPPGIYDYNFNVDGVSMTDPSSPQVFGNRQGSRSFVEIPGPPGQPRRDEWRPVPHGTVTIHWYDSPVTGTRRRLHVYCPPGYGKDLQRKYPVLYLLHGSGDNDSHWMHIGRANIIADNLLADGKMVPMLIVMPDGHARERPPGPIDAQAHRERVRVFEKDLLEQVRPLVESSYRVRPDATGRAIAGLSMGSAQALTVGLGHLDQFAWIGAFSGAIDRDDPVLTGLRGEPAKINDRLELLWLAIGKDDVGLKHKRDLDATLKELGVRHEYHETDGAHRWSVWRGYLADFMPRLFRQTGERKN